MFGRARSFYSESDGVTRVIAFAAFVILLIIALPGLAPRVPGFTNGSTCTSLISPSGNGSNQSLLAAAADPNSLRLELVPEKDTFGLNESIMLNVRFVNDSAAPMTLAIVPEEAVFRYTGREQGLSFYIADAAGNTRGEPANIKQAAPIRQQFPSNILHVLSPRQRCVVPVSITPYRWQAAGLTTGQYQIIAVYINTSRGALSAVGLRTPTPVFRDQGVWVTAAEGVRSNTVMINMGAAR